MYPFIKIGIVQIPVYSLLFIIGYVIIVFIARAICGKYGIAKDDMLYASIYAALGLAAGAKVFFFLSKIPDIVTHFPKYIRYWRDSPMGALNYSFGGLVFYGGLIGAVLGILIYCRQYKVRFWPFLDVTAPLIPFVHGIGRIGCFFAGCCYGKEYHGFGSVRFPYNEAVPELNEVPRIPVQLIEAGLNFVIAAVLFVIMKKVKMKTGQMMGIYLLYYTVMRTLMETMRGDVIRGNIGVLSTSQIVSIILFPVGVVLLKGIKAADSENV